MFPLPSLEDLQEWRLNELFLLCTDEVIDDDEYDLYCYEQLEPESEPEPEDFVESLFR
jgi:hypothetical protein